MPSFIQYHNTAKLGWVPIEGRPFLDTHLGIVTRRAIVQQAIGSTVYLIVNLGQPKKRYYLWERFQIESVEPQDGAFCAQGPGWQLVPPRQLHGPAFEEFRTACANFIGFRNIDDLPYRTTLEQIANEARRNTVDEATESFASQLIEALPASADGWFARGFVRLQRGNRAGSIQDLEEAIRRNTPQADRAREYLALARGLPG
jgi:hypothetical protein